MSGPRGSIVFPSRPVDIGGGCEATGRKPGVVVFVKGGSAALMRKLDRYCRFNGIDVRVCHDEADAWECVAAPSPEGVEALEGLIEHPAVKGWQFILNVRPPRSAMGSGEERPRPASGTAFGRPATAAATRAALETTRAKRAAGVRPPAADVDEAAPDLPTAFPLPYRLDPKAGW